MLKYFGNAYNWAERREIFIHFGLVVELRELADGLLKFCCIALGRIRSILRQINFAKGSSAEFFNEFEVFTNNKV